MKRYNPTEIEPKWQQIWKENQRYVANDFDAKQKFYISCMFPYPSAAGMHIGHAMEHSVVDAIARFQRAHGKNVMNPMGWDAFGLPAENYAIKTGTAPAVVTKENIANFKNQLDRLGASLDWSREINTSDPEYYKWTQWVFTQFFERGLAYQKEANQWWCPVDMTVLANEQVENGHCWRCGSLVEKKAMKQWFFKITDYADALLKEIPDLDWPEKIKTAQTNWIGRSEGAEIDFKIEGLDESLTVFTTRPDTIFGATFMVIAPEHPLASTLATADNKKQVTSYITEAIKKSEIDRAAEGKDKTGVCTGSYAINPANNKRIPIWIADYVLGGYGTGAIMAVPAHDQRDYAFAQQYSLPVKQVVANYHEYTDAEFGPRAELETLNRPTVDAFIVNQDGKYLIQSENAANVHFVGGGIDPEDETEEIALRREILEEVGFNKILSIKQAAPYNAALSYRHTKHKNQKTWGCYYEVVVDSTQQVPSEIQDGKHTIEWVGKSEVAGKLTWRGHANAWDAYLRNELIPVDVSEGLLVNSGQFDGMPSSEARENITSWLEEQGVGRGKVTYKMRDWLISRQRYWGAPIPIVHCEKDGAVAVPAEQLPVVLPEVEDYVPKGQSVLATVEDWVNTTCPSCGGPAKRETDTMDGYACSSWYLLRYTDPKNAAMAWDPANANYWSPVDYYVGGDHAVAHLLYVRFWNHIFKDMRLVPTNEPVKKLVYHGLIQAEDGRKMSKSLGNVIDPLDIIDQGYGADALRTFLLFVGPIDDNSAWSAKGIAGVYRFLNRVWTLIGEFISSTDKPTSLPTDKELLIAKHRAVKKVTDDYHRLSFNTAIAALMEYTNELYRLKADGFSTEWQGALEAIVQMIGPVAPHTAAELWQILGQGNNLDAHSWPTYDEAWLVTDTLKIAVQVNGKLRGEVTIDASATEADVVSAAQSVDKVSAHLDGLTIRKSIYVPGRLVNFVAN